MPVQQRMAQRPVASLGPGCEQVVDDPNEWPRGVELLQVQQIVALWLVACLKAGGAPEVCTLTQLAALPMWCCQCSK